MVKVVVNRCYGGYSLSKDAYKYLGIPWDGYGYEFEDDRSDLSLVDCIEALGNKANGRCAQLEVVDIPDDVDWYIQEYDGFENVREKHRIW